MATPFISRQDLTDLKGRDVTADPGATIAVDAACEVVRTLTGQSLDAVTGGTAVLDGSGTDALLLPERPVNNAGTVVINGTTAGSADYSLKDSSYLVLRSGGTITGPTWSTWDCNLGAVWPKGRQNITVTYDHGYSSVPEDLRLVALTVASRVIEQGNAQFETVGDDSIRYAVAATDFTNGEKAICRKYRRVR